jgi:hypothetical protein
MKIDNLQLGLSLADACVGTARQTELMQLADYLLTHPMSRVFYERALLELGIHPDTVPTELWGETVPDEAHGAMKVKEGITILNQQWTRGKLARLVAVRNLAWQSTLLARRLEKQMAEEAKSFVAKNGGSTAGLLRAFVPVPATRAELDPKNFQQPVTENDNG